MEADAQTQQNPMYRTQSSTSSSTYTYFAEQAIREGFPNGNFGGGGHVGSEMFRGRSDMREVIQREIEKERIREEIIAEEIARRRELMMERNMMAMRNGGGLSSPFVPLSVPPSHNNLFEPRMMHPQPIGFEERIAMSLAEKYGASSHRREIRGFDIVPFQRLGDSPKIKGIRAPVSADSETKVIDLRLGDSPKIKGIRAPVSADSETKVIDLAKPTGSKRKTPPPVIPGSTKPHPDGSKKKLKEEWSCAICQVTATSEQGLNEHLQGKKHQAKETALIAHKTGANFGLGVSPKKPIVKPVKLTITTINPNPSAKNPKPKPKPKNENPKPKPKNEKPKPKNEKPKPKPKNENPKPKPKPKNEKPKPENEKPKPKPKNEKPKPDPNTQHKREKFKFWCEMCEVGAISENVMNNHKEGKRHVANLLEAETKKAVEGEETEVKKTVKDVVSTEEDVGNVADESA